MAERYQPNENEKRVETNPSYRPAWRAKMRKSMSTKAARNRESAMNTRRKMLFSVTSILAGLAVAVGCKSVGQSNASQSLTQKSGTTSSTTNNQTLDVAQRGLAAFQRGWETGDFAAYIAMLTDDFLFWFPAGPHRGKYAGREGREHMVAKCREQAEAGDRLTFAPYRVTSNDTTVMFEFDSKGTISGKPYKGRNAISLDVIGDRISGFREYFGDLA